MKVWEFYENMDEVVYVCDMDSYELVYMNRKAREMIGLRTMEEVQGQKCYQVLQNCSEPCVICNNRKLRPNYFEEWNYFNSILKRNFALKDTVIEEDGRRYRMEIAVDLTRHEQEARKPESILAQESIINEGLRISLATDAPDESIENILAYIGKTLKSERVYIFEERAGQYVDNTYEWCAEGVTPQRENLQGIPREDLSIWLDHFQKHDSVIIKKLENIKESDPVMYDYLLPQDIDSLVVSPLVFNNQIVGFYGVDNPPQELLENISNLFLIMGHFIVLLLRRCELIKQLEQLSFYDQLSGLGNRHAMDRFISRMQPKKSIGIVYCDVTGLKRVNDQQGHKAGDMLLVGASECLRGAFAGYDMFRIGGDEFLVLCTGITEEQLIHRIERLKNDATEHAVVIAVGYVWRPDGTENMDRLLAEADRKMYEDKRQYYMENGRMI